ncbi:MAG TPA: urease accessory UreF family protein [Gemmatimonadales bacterium]|nr:urease accessory UreF family protein [Gemmatimonadales bacterium]
MIETTTRPLVALLHICDSLFPIGGFGYSDGLEAATAAGLIETPADLQTWLDVCLDEVVGRMDGPAALRAWTAFDRQDWQALCELDDETIAMRPSSAIRRSTRAMGLRLVTTWSALYPNRRLEQLLDLAHGQRLGPALPIAFGCACASAGVGMRDAGAAFAYTRLVSATSAALRLMRIGQTDAHARLANALGRVPMVVDTMTTRARLESFTPAMDVSAMAQPYLHSRLFRS